MASSRSVTGQGTSRNLLSTAFQQQKPHPKHFTLPSLAGDRQDPALASTLPMAGCGGSGRVWPTVPRTTSLPPCLKACFQIPTTCFQMQHAKARFRPFQTQQTESAIIFHHTGEKRQTRQRINLNLKLFKNGNRFSTLRSTQTLVRSCSRSAGLHKAKSMYREELGQARRILTLF